MTPGDVVEVKDGYGRNYLLPRGLATAWTKGGEKQVDLDPQGARGPRDRRRSRRPSRSRQTLESKAVRLPVRAGARGRLFGAVTPGDVAEARQVGRPAPQVDRRKVEICPADQDPRRVHRSRCACTPRSRRPSRSRSSPPDPAPPRTPPDRLVRTGGVSASAARFAGLVNVAITSFTWPASLANHLLAS